MAAVAHFPGSLDRGPLERARRPLAVVAALLLVADLIGLGLHLADGVESPFADDAPTRAKTSVGAPEAIVPSSDVFGARADRRPATREAAAAKPLGCLALASGCYPTETSPAPPSSPGASTPSPPSTPPPSTQPVPVAQADVAVPALGTQVSVGLGDGSCTSVNLTVLALGDCPVSSGDGPVILNLGGSLLGE